MDAGQTWFAYTAPFTITTPGATSLLYRASDIAGNVAQFQKEITITYSVSGLLEYLDHEYIRGQISSQGVYQSLRQKLVKATSDFNQTPPNKTGAIKKVSDFVSQVQKEYSKGTISGATAIHLQNIANFVLTTLMQKE